MPIDPQIPLMVQPPQQAANPLAQFEALQNMAALNEQRQVVAEQRQQQMQAAQQAQAEHAAMNHALQSTVDADGNIDVDAASKWLVSHGFSTAAETLQTNHAKLVSSELDNRKKAGEALSTDLQNLQRSASAVNDQGSWTAFRNEVARVKGPAYANAIPAQFSPENKLGLMSWFDDAKDSVNRQKLTLDAITEARQTNDPKKWQDAIGSLSFLPQDRYTSALAEVKQVMPPTLRYLADAAKTPQDAANLAITPEQRQQSAQVAAGQAETAQYHQAQLANEQKRLGLEQQRINNEQGGAGPSDNVVQAVAAMKAGTAPPLLPGRATKEYLATIAEAKRQGFDLAKANEDWTATQKHLATMNGQQQERLRQAITFTRESLPLVRSLVNQWDSLGVPVLSAANLKAAASGAYGNAAQSLAVRLTGQIADLTSELGTVYKGGNSSTDESLALAGKNLQGNWSKQAALDALDQIDVNIGLREKSMRLSKPVTSDETNAFDRSKSGVPDEVTKALATVGPGKHTLSDGSVWIKDASGAIRKGG